MEKVKTGLIAGFVFGIVDVLIMLPLEMQDKSVAMIGAFASRFAIGFLIPNVELPLSPCLKGLTVGLLISLPDAIITNAYGPVLGIGILGGIVIGWLSGKRG